MFKSTTYLLLIITAGTMILLLALTLPQIFVEEQRSDSQDDLLRAVTATRTQQLLMAYEQIVAAQSASSDSGVVGAFRKKLDDVRDRVTDEDEEDAKPFEVPVLSPSKGKLEELCATLAQKHRQDMLVIVDREGKVLASAHESGPGEGDELAGLPPVKDALSGVRRDWLWSRPDEAMQTAGSPIILAVGDKMEIVGAVLVGERMDSSMAGALASRIDPQNSGDGRFDVAFIQKGKSLGSSVKDDQIQRLIGNTADTYKDSMPPSVDPSDPGLRKQIGFKNTPDGRRLASFTMPLGDGPEGASFGLVIIQDRKNPNRSILSLAADAYTLEVPAGQGVPWVVLIGLALVIFLTGWLLMTNEYGAPGRKLVKQLQEIEKHIEEGEVDLKKMRGPLFQSSKLINTILTGLRMRLSRERTITPESLIPADAIEALDPAPIPQQAAPAQEPFQPEGLPFSDSREIQLPNHEADVDALQNAIVEKPAPQRVELDDSFAERRPVSPFLTHEDAVDPEESAFIEEEESAAPTEALAGLPVGASELDALLGELEDVPGGEAIEEPEPIQHQGGAASVEHFDDAEAVSFLEDDDFEDVAAPIEALDDQIFGAEEDEDDDLIGDYEEEEGEEDFAPTQAVSAPVFNDSPLISSLPSAASWASRDPEEDENPSSDAEMLMEALTSSQAAEALSRDLEDRLGSNTGQPDVAALEDSTIDIEPDQLKGLISLNSESSHDAPEPSFYSSDEDDDPPVRIPRDDSDPTRVDSIGIMQQLANEDSSVDGDVLDGSAIAASSAARSADAPASPPEVITAELKRGNKAFDAALAASTDQSSSPPPSSGVRKALDPKALLDNLRKRNRSSPKTPAVRPISSPSIETRTPSSEKPFGDEPSAVRPFPPGLEPPRNPFRHEAPTTPGTAPKKTAENIDPDQQYFEKLYEQFVRMKVECGESTEGLTMDKFVRRLHRNKAQLMERYKCRSVRFQVYVKQGKAALKATPIK